MKDIKVIAFDLDGTLTQHKTRLQAKNRNVLDRLSEKYKLLMVGAGQSGRICEQMGRYPIDILGNYGMQYCKYNAEIGALDRIFDERLPCDRDSVEQRITELRRHFGNMEYTGANVEYLKTLRMTNKDTVYGESLLPATEDIKWVHRDVEYLTGNKTAILDHWNELYEAVVG